MFSPIAQRSLGIRLFFFSIYTALAIGGLTMVVPFMIMLNGAVESSTQAGAALFPSWLTQDEPFWRRYLEAKYRAAPDLLRMAWSNPDASFRKVRLSGEEPESTATWEAFLRETKPGPDRFALGFLRQNARMPSSTGREFRIWLLRQYEGDLTRLNADLGMQFQKVTAILPPNLQVTGPATTKNAFLEKFHEFCTTQPQSRLVPWDAGGYYRAVFLPRTLGNDVSAYNLQYGTHYTSYREVPFPSIAPSEGREQWHFFVGKVLRPDFVELTADGEAARSLSGLSRQEFIRTRAKAEHLRVTSLDVQFAEWAAGKGMADERIPQKTLDRVAFESEAGYWRWEFLTLNFRQVLDEILLHGRAILNTVILVVLSVTGALIVNPLAAYALSRFKLKQTYFILLFCLATLSFPAEVTMIPVFLQMKEWYLLNTFGALILPSVANGFSIFLLKGFFDSLPKELYEAAELDGASEWMMFWQITLTLSKPILAIIALGAFTSAYGAFFYALILAPDPKMWTIMVNIYQLRMTSDPPVVYASLILAAIPTLTMFLFCQNLILRGIVVPTEK